MLDTTTGQIRHATSSDFIAREMFTQTPAPTVRWSPDGTRIAYVSGTGALSQVLVADRSGARVNVSAAAGWGFDPDWSPDGGRIVFSGNGGLHTVNADGSGSTRVLAPPTGNTVGYSGYSDPSWAPDGGRIGFLSSGQIQVMNADGSSPAPVGAAGALSSLTWSPDGSRIAFSRGGGAGARLWTMATDGSDARPLVAAGGPDRGTTVLSWSTGPPLTRRLLPPPDVRAVNASVVSGKVLVRRPGSRRFSRLTDSERMPYGSELDTRRGRVRIVAEAGGGATATSEFHAGRFRLARRARAVTELILTGPLAGCRSARRRQATAAARSGRRLWGDGKGRFRTRGRRSAATITGTVWLVEDRCDGSTLTRVRRGAVKVRDFGRRRTVTVRSGGRYVARP